MLILLRYQLAVWADGCCAAHQTSWVIGFPLPSMVRIRNRRGRVGKKLMSKEGPDLYQGFREAGSQAVYEPVSVLHHRVGAERVERKWLLCRFYWQGVSQVIFDNPASPKSRGRAVVELLGQLKKAAFVYLGDSINPSNGWLQIRGGQVLAVGVRRASARKAEAEPLADRKPH